MSVFCEFVKIIATVLRKKLLNMNTVHFVFSDAMM